MSEEQLNLSKRRFLQTAIGTGLGLGLGGASGFTIGKQQSMDAKACLSLPHSEIKYDCYGDHQAGIVTQEQSFCILSAFDISGQRLNSLENLLRMITSRIIFLTQGNEIPENNPKLPPLGSGILGKKIPADGLTITVSLGHSVFDHRFGLQSLKPRHLQEMKDFPNDKLIKEWCDGDLTIQFCANSPETCMNALRDILKNTASMMVLRWTIDGFLPKSEPNAAPRNLFGFHDGSGDPDISDPEIASNVVWTGENAHSADEPKWTKGGSYQAARLIRNFVEFWDRTPLQEQETIFGREKYSGAPLGMKYEKDTPDYSKDPDGKTIPLDAHMRLANNRHGDFKKHLLHRRPYNYSLGLMQSGRLNVGLIFICYQSNLDNSFIYIQNQLNGEPLEEYISPFGGGYFFSLPGFKQSEFLGQALISQGQLLS